MDPIYQLLRKGVEFKWTNQCQNVYQQIKEEVSSDHVLVHFNPKLEIVLTTDACNTAVAGILSHKFEYGSLKPIAFVSRALQSSERNYSTVEKEALAIVFSVTKLRQNLLGNKFTLRTDHKPLLTLFGECKGLPVMASARIQRWALNLSGFDYSVEYVKGSVNEAYSLSRIPQVPLTQTQTEKCSYVNFVTQLKLKFPMHSQTFPT